MSFPGGLRRYFCCCCSRSTLYGDSCTACSLPPTPPPPAIALVRSGCLRRQFGQPRTATLSHPLSLTQTRSAQHPPSSHDRVLCRGFLVDHLAQTITTRLSTFLPSPRERAAEPDLAKSISTLNPTTRFLRFNSRFFVFLDDSLLYFLQFTVFTNCFFLVAISTFIIIEVPMAVARG